MAQLTEITYDPDLRFETQFQIVTGQVIGTKPTHPDWICPVCSKPMTTFTRHCKKLPVPTKDIHIAVWTPDDKTEVVVLEKKRYTKFVNGLKWDALLKRIQVAEGVFEVLTEGGKIVHTKVV